MTGSGLGLHGDVDRRREPILNGFILEMLSESMSPVKIVGREIQIMF